MLQQTQFRWKGPPAPGRALSVVQNIDFRSPDDIDDRQTPFQSEVGIEFRARFDTQANHCAP